MVRWGRRQSIYHVSQRSVSSSSKGLRHTWHCVSSGGGLAGEEGEGRTDELYVSMYINAYIYRETDDLYVSMLLMLIYVERQMNFMSVCISILTYVESLRRERGRGFKI